MFTIKAFDCSILNGRIIFLFYKTVLAAKINIASVGVQPDHNHLKKCIKKTKNV